MLETRIVTTGQAAQLCQVSRRALNNWIREGKLKAYTAPGGHYRIRLLDLEEFRLRHGFIQQALDSGADAWLGKPFTRQELQDRVRELLSAGKTQPVALTPSHAPMPATVRAKR